MLLNVLLTLVIIVIAALLLYLIIDRVHVYEYERGLYYKRGVLSVLAPGGYWFWAWSSEVNKVDLRLRYITIPGQELLSRDNISLKLSVVASYDYGDFLLAQTKIKDIDNAVYLEIQVVLRDVIGELSVADIVEKRNEISQRLQELCPARLTPLGIQLKSIYLKDVIFPGEIKKIFSEIVKAQKEGIASLERTRGETAALRNLVNASKLIEDHPHLLQLRVVQAINSSSGNTIVFESTALKTANLKA